MKKKLIIVAIAILIIAGGIYLISEFKIASLRNKMVKYLEKRDYTCESDGNYYAICTREDYDEKKELKVFSNHKTMSFTVYEGNLKYEMDTYLSHVYLREDNLGVCYYYASSSDNPDDMQKIKYNEKLKMDSDFVGVNKDFPCYKYLPKANDYLAEFYDIVNYFEEIK